MRDTTGATSIRYCFISATLECGHREPYVVHQISLGQCEIILQTFLIVSSSSYSTLLGSPRCYKDREQSLTHRHEFFSPRFLLFLAKEIQTQAPIAQTWSGRPKAAAPRLLVGRKWVLHLLVCLPIVRAPLVDLAWVRLDVYSDPGGITRNRDCGCRRGRNHVCKLLGLSPAAGSSIELGNTELVLAVDSKDAVVVASVGCAGDVRARIVGRLRLEYTCGRADGQKTEPKTA